MLYVAHDSPLRIFLFSFHLPLCWIALSVSANAANPTGTRLEKILTGRNDITRLRALATIDQTYADRLEALPQLRKAVIHLASKLDEDNRDEPLQPGIAKTIATLAKIDRPEATEALTDTLNSPSIAWITFVVDQLAKNKHHTAIPALVDTLDYELCQQHYGLRFSVIRSLLQMKHPDAIEALGRIRHQIDGQLQHKLDVELEKVTLEDFHNDQQRFDKWHSGEYLLQPVKKNLSPNSMFKAASFSASKDRLRLTRQKYYDIDIYAKKLLFVIDRSGSMNTVGYRGTRLQKAKQELIAAIKGLEEDTEFGILVFDTHVRSYRDDLQTATNENKRKAIRYVAALTGGKKTNTYEAMRKAIDFDDQLEAIFILTDGQPTTGPLIAPTQILQDILRRNEVRNITINTVAIAVDESMRGFLKSLSVPSDGEFRVVH